MGDGRIRGRLLFYVEGPGPREVPMGIVLPWRRRARGNDRDTSGFVRRRLRFTGKVQAVGFRYTATCVADEDKVTGWVKNLPDGDVLLEVQGLPKDVDAYERALLDECASDRTWIEATVASRENVPVVEGEKSFGVTY